MITRKMYEVCLRNIGNLVCVTDAFLVTVFSLVSVNGTTNLVEVIAVILEYVSNKCMYIFQIQPSAGIMWTMSPEKSILIDYYVIFKTR